MTKEESNAKSRERYANDPVYRQQKIDRAKKRTEDNREEINKSARIRKAARKATGNRFPSETKEARRLEGRKRRLKNPYLRKPRKIKTTEEIKEMESARYLRKKAKQTPESKKRQAANARRHYWKHRDQILGERRKRNSENPEARRKISRIYFQNNLNARLSKNLRERIRAAVRGKVKKAANTITLVGCSIEHLKLHIRVQFREGMNWENYGKVWHIDHIIPCARFNLVDPEQQLICFNWKNLQPLFVDENMKKHARLDYVIAA
jgi:hypothetical protein